MWICPSRGRPGNIARLIAAYNETGATTPVWLRLDDDDPNPEYIHENWTVEIGQRLPLSDTYAEAFRRYPDSPFYGFIADDVVPKTRCWDTELISLAGPYGMAVPAGGHGGTPHFVLGGELVRYIGHMALPGLDRLYIDTVWHDIANKLGVLRYAPEVILEHRHFSNGKALFDSTYRKKKKAEDKIIYKNWSKNDHSS